MAEEGAEKVNQNDLSKVDWGTWADRSNEDDSGVQDPSKRLFLKTTGKAMLAAAVISNPIAQKAEQFAQSVDKSSSSSQETAMPTDIISREELASKYHTHIHDLPQSEFPDNYVELNFRKSAEDVPLFQMLEKGQLIDLDVFLIDSDRLDTSKFTQEQKAFMSNQPAILAGLERRIDEAREYNRKEISEHKDQVRESYQKELSDLTSQRSELNVDRYNVQLQALNYRYGRYLSDEPSDDDLNEVAIRGYSPTDGSATDSEGRSGARNFIFIAVRDKPQTITFTSGNESLTISNNRRPYIEEHKPDSYAPNPSQSFPTLDSFEVSDDPNDLGYVILGGETPGFIFRHESQHSQGVLVETDADLRALKSIDEASKHMKETGSDEQYWVVFRTPEGVTITETPQQPLTM